VPRNSSCCDNRIANCFLFTYGIKVKVVYSSRPLCPASFKTSATMAQLRLSCAFLTQIFRTFTTWDLLVFPFSFKKVVHVFGFPAEVEYYFHPFTHNISISWFQIGYNMDIFTAKGFCVLFLHFWISFLKHAWIHDPAPINTHPTGIGNLAAANCRR